MRIQTVYHLESAVASATPYIPTLKRRGFTVFSIKSSDFSISSIKEKKQAEFLFYEAFPFSLVEKIGVYDQNIQTQTQALLSPSSYPIVQIEPGWYF